MSRYVSSEYALVATLTKPAAASTTPRLVRSSSKIPDRVFELPDLRGKDLLAPRARTTPRR
jgi:hypothetical protein